jgi:hypothetical protein
MYNRYLELYIIHTISYHNLGLGTKYVFLHVGWGTKSEPILGGIYTSFYRSYLGFWYKIFSITYLRI